MSDEANNSQLRDAAGSENCCCRTPVVPEGACPPIAHYTPGILAGDTLYISGQLGIDGQGNLVSGEAGPQAEQAMKNMGSVLKTAGMNYENLVKCTVFLSELSDGKVSTVNSASFFLVNQQS
jgi:2-iminobutanoate/2-iminopropanoate deaminase